MCGITGWFSHSPKIDKAESILQPMMNAIKHRGPDGNNIYTSEHVGFAHTRLAIIDLVGGKQPMQTEDGQLVITFNGEIYNYKSLRNDLIHKGCTFCTDSDTEVILKLYQYYGWSGFNQLRGMYAFALWDYKNKQGLLVRDPIGIKPLFISTQSNNDLIFGSEAKAILAFKNSRAEMDTSSLHLLLNFRYIPGDSTMFKGIKQLAPGSVLIWQANEKPKQYYLEPKFNDSKINLLESLSESVDMHCTSDVEVGCYLSGGIDSAAICALAKNSVHNLRTFTLNAGDDPNEAKNAAVTANLLGVENISGTIPSEVSDLSRLVRHLEVPKINAYQISRLAQHTSQHVKVTLSGLGADELFYGYNAHQIFYKSCQINRHIPSFAAKNISNIGDLICEKILSAQWTEPQRAFQILGALQNWPRIYGLLRNVWDSKDMRSAIYGPRMLDCDLPEAFMTIENSWPKSNDPLKSMALFEWKNKMVNDLLWQEDRLSMAEGLEVRVPFLDIDFANRVNSIDRSVLMPKGELKGHMKQMLRDVLPMQILTRPKSGFQIDAPLFVSNSLASLIKNWLSLENINKYGLFNPTFVQNVLKQPPKKWFRWHYFMIYLMLLTHIWVAEFEDSK